MTKHYPLPPGHVDLTPAQDGWSTQLESLSGCTKLTGVGDRCGEERNGDSTWCYEHDREWAQKVKGLNG